MATVLVRTAVFDGCVLLVTINRLHAKNAVNGECAKALYDVFDAFEKNPNLLVAVLEGEGGTFCAGADLKDFSNPLEQDGPMGPMGPSRMALSKPVIAAVEGFAVAGGLELACWCDMRVVASNAVFGVFCRRWGVPLIDGGTVRLARLIGMSRAMDMVLTGRAVSADEAFHWGLANRIVSPGTTRDAALQLARQIASFPQETMRADRSSLVSSFSMSVQDALKNEFRGSVSTLAHGAEGAKAFRQGQGRGGTWGSSKL